MEVNVEGFSKLIVGTVLNDQSISIQFKSKERNISNFEPNNMWSDNWYWLFNYDNNIYKNLLLHKLRHTFETTELQACASMM